MPIDWNQTFASRTIAPPAPKQNFLQKAGGFIGGAAKDAYSTLIGTPGTRIGQAIVAPLNLQKNQASTDLQNTNTTTAQMLADAAKKESDPVKKQQYQAQASKLLNQGQSFVQAPDQTDSNASGVNVPAQKTGLAGVEQIGGQALKSASYLYGGQGLGVLGETAGVGGKILQGAKVGAVAGAGGGAGNAMEQGGNFGQVAGGAIQGGVIGGLTGGVIGGATAAIHPIFSRSTPIMNPADVGLTNAEQGISEAQAGVSSADQNVNLARQNLSPELKAQENIRQAQSARQQATGGAVQGVNDIQTGVQATTKNLGTKFSEGAQNLHTTDPGTTVPITKSQLEQLNAIREGKKFALPDFANTEGTKATLGGKPINLGTMNPKVASQIGATGNEVGVSLTRPQMQDLMAQVNKATFDAKTSGEFAVNQQLIGLRNELKATASKTFGSKWDKLYSDYHTGMKTVEELQTEINLKKGVPLDKTMSRISDLGKTPEGKAMLQQYLDNTKAETGLDLSDPVKAIHQVMDSQTSLEGANAQLKEAQDNYSQALKEMEKNKAGAQENLQTAQATLQQVHEEIATKIAKGGWLKQLGRAVKEPRFVARHGFQIASTVVGVSIAATAFRKAIGNFFSGQ